jgi:hypothetical protein
VEVDIDEALRYLGVRGAVPEELRRETEAAAARLTSLRPRYVYQVFPLEKPGRAGGLCRHGPWCWRLLRRAMLAECGEAALMACTLGAQFDAMLLREQARDMSRAAILDACGSAYVEAGCDEAERELAARLPGRFLTDRFSPGYGDLPLDIQRAVGAALNMEKLLGLHVTDSLMLNPVKSVTAVIGIADTPQMARIRGCAYCALKETCPLRRGRKALWNLKISRIISLFWTGPWAPSFSIRACPRAGSRSC